MDAPMVSIIVPVYNVEQYLPRCLNSIRNQTWKDFECILVNDGSTDGSPELCRAAAAEDGRFRIIDQPNSGVSKARNAALEQARGKYLQFVDGDDYLTADATATFVRTAETTGADLVLSRFYRVADERTSVHGHIRTDGVMTRQELAERMMSAPANFYYGVLWNKFYRRQLVETHRIRFEPEVSWCEDFMFNLEYIRYARLVATVRKPLYHYIKRGDSLVNSVNLSRTIQMKKDTFACYKELYQALDLYDEKKAQVYRYLISSATDGGAFSLPERKPRPAKTGKPNRAPIPAFAESILQRGTAILTKDNNNG